MFYSDTVDRHSHIQLKRVKMCVRQSVVEAAYIFCSDTVESHIHGHSWTERTRVSIVIESIVCRQLNCTRSGVTHFALLRN